MSKVRKVLSIDGGGIRGILPAMLLEHIENETGRSVSQMFDLIVGTSTGGILALGLVTPSEDGSPKYKAEELVNLYQSEGSNIFNRSGWYWLKSIGALADSKYPVEGIEEVLEKYFEDAMLSDALTEVMITGYEIERRRPWFFRSRRAKDSELSKEYDFPMKIVARATSAAPTYFDPKEIAIPDEKDYYALVDGGVFANNPAMCAYVEAKNHYPDDDILMVSLGTGELTRRIPLDEAKDWGLAKWAKPIIDVVFDGVADTISYQLKQLLPEDRYFRFQIRLNEGNDDMDDASKTNLRVLKLMAEKLINEEQDQFEGMLKTL